MIKVYNYASYKMVINSFQLELTTTDHHNINIIICRYLHLHNSCNVAKVFYSHLKR